MSTPQPWHEASSGDSYDVVVVGGGAGGLAAAVTAAALGASVLVLAEHGNPPDQPLPAKAGSG